jgi:hypothetical protein
MSEQPYGPGAMCDHCGHFAARHDEDGCHFDRPDPEDDCGCPVMRWLDVDWPRPWLPAPDGLSPAVVRGDRHQEREAR